jgi:hypothetical protein
MLSSRRWEWVASATVAVLVTLAVGCSDSVVGPNGRIGNASALQLPGLPLTSSVTVTLDSTPVAVTHPDHATAVARDANGNTLSGKITLWSSSNTNVATVGQDGSITTSAVGSAQIRATIDGVTGSATLTVVAPGPPPPTQLAITTQPGGAVSGSRLAPQPVVEVREANNQRSTTSSASITAAIASGNGTLSGTVTVTAVNGVATFSDLSIAGSGPFTLVFASTGLTTATSNSFTMTAAPATQLSITTQPSSSAQSGVAFARQPVIQLRDASGTAVSQSGVVVTAAIAGGGGTMGGTATATTNASGVATFTNLSISGATGQRTLSFGATSLNPVTSSAINITNSPTKLSITTQPAASAQSGVAFSRQPVIQLVDQFGSTVRQSGVTITVVIATGGGTLGGTVSAATDANGAASFVDLSISGAAGSRTLTFNSTGLSGAVSDAITITTSATQLAITTQPSSSAPSGVAFGQQPVIQLRDGSNSPVSQSGVVVTAAIWTGGGTLGGTTTATTNASGVASFTNLSITGAAGGRTLSFSAPSLSAVVSNTITISNAPPATELTITTQPSSSATSGTAFAQQPVIQLRDASNNAVNQSGIVVTASIASGTGTLGGTLSATTGASGAVTFSNLKITGSGSNTLGFAASGLTGATSTTINVTSGGGFATPNILNNASFEGDWGGFTDWSNGTPSGVALDNTKGFNGTSSVLRSWTPNPNGDGGAQFLYHLSSAGFDRVWMRIYVRITAPIASPSVMKFGRFYDTGFNTNLGGLGMADGNEIFTWGTGFENSSIATPIGLNQSQVVDGNWHSLEVDYWRNGDPSGYPSAAFWFDGAQIGMPDGTPVKYAGSGNNSYWSGGRLYAGDRQNSLKLGYIEMLATLNQGNTTSGQINMDRVAFSTAGRIGP